MSDQVLLQLNNDQQTMTRQAMRFIIVLAVLIHLLLNVYAQKWGSDFLKIEIPVMSAVSACVVTAILLINRNHRHPN